MSVTADLTDVAGYAAAVRRALAGLGTELVEDLTDGLEADLAEALADEGRAGHGGDLVALFGTPEEYAAELGAAAGLVPEAVPEGRRLRLPAAVRHPVRAVAAAGAHVLGRLRRRQWWAPVESFLVALRPVWWVVRGWVLYQLPARVFDPFGVGWLPRTLPSAVLVAVLVVLSVQWGRGRWRLPRFWRGVAVAVSTVAAVAAVPMLLAGPVTQVRYVYEQAPTAEAPQDGVYVDGMQVSNLFVYDAQGNPLEDVQVYDDRGRPVRTVTDGSDGQYRLYGNYLTWSWVPAVDEFGQERWNAYPLLGAASDEFVFDEATGRTVPGDDAEVRTPPRPFAKAPAIVVPGGEASDEQGSASDESTPASDEAAAPGDEATAPPGEPTASTEASTAEPAS